MKKDLHVAVALIVGVSLGFGLGRWHANNPGSAAPRKDATQPPATDSTAQPAHAYARITSAPGIAADLAPGAAPATDPQRKLAEQLLGEAVSPAWASFNERQVRVALAESQLAVAGLEPPLRQRVQCRSTLCRIELSLLEGEAAQQTPLHLLQAIAANLDDAQVFEQPRGDGTVEVVIYARHGTQP
ncbi:MAG TPA: hypothetical protein VGD21_03890 [Lysobacter sp.]